MTDNWLRIDDNFCIASLIFTRATSSLSLLIDVFCFRFSSVSERALILGLEKNHTFVAVAQELNLLFREEESFRVVSKSLQTWGMKSDGFTLSSINTVR